MIAHRPSTDRPQRPDPMVDRSMLIVQYLISAIALGAAATLAAAS